MVNLRRQLAARAPALVRRLSTEVKAAEPLKQDDPLYRRLSKLGNIKGMVASTINEYIREGRIVGKAGLGKCVKELRKYKRYDQALEIMEWMEFRKFNFGYKDYAIRLDLIAKVKGIAEAEFYFSHLPASARVQCTHGALLNSYCVEKMTDKALDLFDKMVKENMINVPLPFNNLMTLYLRSGQPEKVVSLYEDMKKMNIRPDTVTHNLLMNSYSHLNDIEGVERVFEEMKLENWKQCDWTTYSNLAAIYTKGGYQEKAKLALKNLEERMGAHDREAYHFLISLYAGISDLDNVHRVWKLLKSTMKVVTNRSYLVMFQALGNLNDIEGMKKCFTEWESVCCSYDLMLLNAVIGPYLKHDMLEEAESALERATKKTKGPFLRQLEMFMVFHLKKGQIQQALEIMEMITSKVENDEWRFKPHTIGRFLDYFKQKGDVSSAEEFYKLMKKINCVDSSLYVSLLEIYAGAGQTMVDMRARIKRDGVEMSEEIERLLASVCPE
ncbi:hypothetical protein ACS0TY_005175 [Phlomoides rotata]